jgi:RNA polymerase sigma-70 factor (ECF subfamily)
VASIHADAELIREVHAGNTDAEAVLWEQYRARVRFFLLRRLNGDREAADDLEQEVFIALLKAVREGRLKETGNVGAYLYQTSFNLATLWARRARRAVPAGDVDLLHTDETPETIRLTTENHERLRRLVGALGSIDRRILDLRFGEEWSYREIATELALSENAVRQRVCRAVAGLRGRLLER